MRRPALHLITSAFLLFLSPSLAHFSLSELQPISGFSDACTQAYNTPLTDCTVSDFYEGRACSPQCVAFLTAMTKLLNDECRGIIGFPNTLIGMFFKGTAVGKLCPGVDVMTVSATGAGVGGVARPSSPARPTADEASGSPTQVSVMVTSTTSEVASTTSTSSIASSTSTSTSSALTTLTSTTSQPTSTQTLEPGLGGGVTASPSSPNSGTSSSSTGADQAGSTAASQNNGGGGGNNNGNGGTVLDAASGPVSSAGTRLWALRRVWTLSAGFAGVLWLL